MDQLAEGFSTFGESFNFEYAKKTIPDGSPQNSLIGARYDAALLTTKIKLLDKLGDAEITGSKSSDEK